MAINKVKCFIAVTIIVIIIGIPSYFYVSFKPPIYVYDVLNVTQSNEVCRIIHQSWKSKDVPGRFRQYSLSWTGQCFKHWKYMFWTDSDNLNLITLHYPWFLAKYNSLPSAIHRADVSRYFYLFHYGGIYTDLDNECLRPFEHLLGNFSLVFGAMKGQYGGTALKEGYVQNSFMYSQPRHPFWLDIIFSVLNSKIDQPEVQTGPVLLTKTIERFRLIGLDQKMMIYPPNYFNPFSWLYKNEASGHCKDFNRMSDDDWKKCKEYFISNGSYVVQYHAHTWGK